MCLTAGVFFLIDISVHGLHLHHEGEMFYKYKVFAGGPAESFKPFESST